MINLNKKTQSIPLLKVTEIKIFQSYQVFQEFYRMIINLTMQNKFLLFD